MPTRPRTFRSDVSDLYHSVEVADPFRWLEDDNAPETLAWVREQNRHAEELLATIPQREEFRLRLTELWNFRRTSAPFERGGRYFSFTNDGLQNQGVLVVRDHPNGDPRVALDPNLFSEDGTVALGGLDVTDDGRLIAYSVTDAGSDWQVVRIRDLESGSDLDDLVERVKFSGVSWSRDGKGFFYSRYPEPTAGAELIEQNRNHTLCYHRVGTPQSDDIVVHARPDEPDVLIHAQVDDAGAWLLLTEMRAGNETRLGVKPLGDPNNPRFDLPVEMIVDQWEAEFIPVGLIGETLYVTTTLEASNRRIVAIDLHDRVRSAWREVVPERDDVLQEAYIAGGHLLVVWLRDASTRVTIHDRDGKELRELPLPPLSSLGGLSARADSSEIFYSFNSFLQPPTAMRFDLEQWEAEELWRSSVDFPFDRFETRQVRYRSADGTVVPMFLVHRREIALDGSNPTLLYGYGGFDVPLLPGFSVRTLAWVEQGGIFAMPNLRGGGEFGEAWYHAGRVERKQNVFDDFIAAAEYLISEGYTGSEHLAIHGGSNGGLLVGAVMCQRPELFAAAIPAVGVMDMLRYHRFTIGMAWSADYGTSDDPEHFAILHGYSPLHNLREGVRYPATMVMTADHDDRVVPAHSFKFGARLQECQPEGIPAIVRVETRAGHGAGKPTSMVIAEEADLLAFAWGGTTGAFR